MLYTSVLAPHLKLHRFQNVSNILQQGDLTKKLVVHHFPVNRIRIGSYHPSLHIRKFFLCVAKHPVNGLIDEKNRVFPVVFGAEIHVSSGGRHLLKDHPK